MERFEKSAADGGWQITLFGGLRLWRRAVQPAGEPEWVPVPARFKTTKARLLLTYLAWRAGEPNSRESLADLFWPDAPTDSARNSLRDALSGLRTALASAGLPAEILVTDRATVALDPAAVRPPLTVDVRLFEDALRQAENRARPREERITRLEAGIRLHTGPFLAGEYDPNAENEWIARARADYADRHDAALCLLSTLCAEEGDAPAALRYAEQALKNRPDDETRARRVRTLAERVQELQELNEAVPPAPVAPAEARTRPAPEVTEPAIPLATADAPPARAASSRPVHRVLPVAAGALAVVASGVAVTLASGRRRDRPRAASSLTTSPVGQPRPAPLSTPYPVDPAGKPLTEAEYRTEFERLRVTNRAARPSERLEAGKRLMEVATALHNGGIGDGRLAVACFDQARVLFEGCGESGLVPGAYLGIAKASALRGDQERARFAIREAERRLRLPNHLPWRAEVRMGAGETALDIGLYAEARRLLSGALAERRADQDHYRKLSRPGFSPGEVPVGVRRDVGRCQ
jgi:DNA-binding SARP family transcriptional activator